MCACVFAQISKSNRRGELTKVPRNSLNIKKEGARNARYVQYSSFFFSLLGTARAPSLCVQLIESCMHVLADDLFSCEFDANDLGV